MCVWSRFLTHEVCMLCCADVESEVPTQPPQRHLLVLINPVSGRGKSVQEFQEQVKPLFEMAEINFDILITGGPAAFHMTWTTHTVSPEF